MEQDMCQFEVSPGKLNIPMKTRFKKKIVEIFMSTFCFWILNKHNISFFFWPL
jgi:hypothetical protein